MNYKSERLTKYQIELLATIKKGAPEAGELIDFDQLLEALSWKPTKASAHFSIRALVQRKMIRKTESLKVRRGRRRVCFELTEVGARVLDPRLGVETEPGESLPGVETGLESSVFVSRSGISLSH